MDVDLVQFIEGHFRLIGWQVKPAKPVRATAINDEGLDIEDQSVGQTGKDPALSLLAFPCIGPNIRDFYLSESFEPADRDRLL